MGLHLNQIYVPPANQEAVAKMSDAERKRYSYFDREESSFFFLQAGEPQTLAYALTDSPVGWLAWMIGKFQLLTDNNGDFLTAVDRDTFLTYVTLYWATGTIGSAMRIYREDRLTREEMVPTPHLGTPGGHRHFPPPTPYPPSSWSPQPTNTVQQPHIPQL